MTDAINIIGAGAAKWYNGLAFSPDAIDPSGAYIGAAPSKPMARGIDFGNVKFTDGALLLSQSSAITFANKTGEKSAILTDDTNCLVLRTGENA